MHSIRGLEAPSLQYRWYFIGLEAPDRSVILTMMGTGFLGLLLDLECLNPGMKALGAGVNTLFCRSLSITEAFYRTLFSILAQGAGLGSQKHLAAESVTFHRLSYTDVYHS